MKIWISKYALSGGITEHECERTGDGYVYPGEPFMSYIGFKIGRDAHNSKAQAVKAAEEMREKRIASMRKQLAALELMTFDA